jgi:hypothetical protein
MIRLALSTGCAVAILFGIVPATAMSRITPPLPGVIEQARLVCGDWETLTPLARC